MDNAWGPHENHEMSIDPDPRNTIWVFMPQLLNESHKDFETFIFEVQYSIFEIFEIFFKYNLLTKKKIQSYSPNFR